MEYDQRITQLCDQIAALVHPVRIIIYNCKRSISNELSSFKLCVIVHEGNCGKIEQKIYLSLDCEVPFDVLVYTGEQWNALIKDKYSFASRGIMNGGVVLYESE